MNRIPAPAKINLALLVGPRRADGLHEIATVLQRIDLCDSVTLEPAAELAVEGYRRDTLVRSALAKLAGEAGDGAAWHVQLEKRIPLAAGLGGGSADAGAALALANRTLREPLPVDTLSADDSLAIADSLALDLPQDYWVLIALPRFARKGSTADIYRRFDELGVPEEFKTRRTGLLEALAGVRRPRDFASFPPNDLAAAAGRPAVVDELYERGAFRADVSGAGPAIYALFQHRPQAERAARGMRARARVWVVAPVW